MIIHVAVRCSGLEARPSSGSYPLFLSDVSMKDLGDGGESSGPSAPRRRFTFPPVETAVDVTLDEVSPQSK